MVRYKFYSRKIINKEMKIVHINKDPKPNPTKEWAKILIEKWTRRDKAKAEKMYGKSKSK